MQPTVSITEKKEGLQPAGSIRKTKTKNRQDGKLAARCFYPKRKKIDKKEFEQPAVSIAKKIDKKEGLQPAVSIPSENDK